MNFTTTLASKQLIASKNIAEELTQKELDNLAAQVIHDYTIDLESRADWETRNKEALELALQITQTKTEPWVNASNVMFPLVTIAALQCHAREYPALLSGTEVVKCRVIGDDADGQKTARAKRVASHMSYQVFEEDLTWEDQMDRVMFTKPIVGTTFKKVYFDATLKHNVSEMVLAQDLVIPYKAKSLEKASRITHVMTLSKNEIYERVARGVFIDALDPKTTDAPEAQTPLGQVSDTLQGQRETAGDADKPFTVLEQHRYLDLDGDGYAEPYIVTVAKQTQTVLRIVARYFDDDIEKKNGRILYIRPQHFFVKYGMIPSPDGGIYDLGFGSLLGPLNRSVNTLINQIIDAGTLNNLGGGFLGRGAKLRRGQNQFRPGEWKQVDGTGADLKNSIVPLPINEPSQVLFALLGMLINYGERISGTTDIMSGQNVGQNTPASTAQELIKQGSVIFNGIFKRTYRSLRDEFRMLYRLNQLYLQNQTSYEELSTGNSVMITRNDYLGAEHAIRPAADPNTASAELRLQQAMLLKQAAMTGPGYNALGVEKRFLEAAQIPYISEVWDEQIPPKADPKAQVEQGKMQIAQMKLEFEQNKLKVEMQYKMLELMQTAEKLKAEVMELEARAYKQIKEADGVEADNITNLINAQIAAKKIQQDGIIQSVKIIKELMDTQREIGAMNGGLQVPMQREGMGGMAPPSGNEGGATLPQLPPGTTEGGLG